MKVTVLYFANIKEQTQSSEDQFILPEDSNLKDLLHEVKLKYQKLESLIFNIKIGSSDTALALNQELVSDLNVSLKENDEVAFIPPISGG